MTAREFLARSPAGRQPALRTAAGEGGTAEEGFTLIELMVVLLIMAILLAIAIPTFLSVTNGAKKTATQSDLTNTLESAQALYTRTQKFPTNGKFIPALSATQTTIKYVVDTKPTKGKNVLSATQLNTTNAIFSGIDGATWCWVAAINEGSTTHTGSPPGDSFTGFKVNPSTPATAKCTVGTVFTAVRTLGLHFYPNFKTVAGT